MNLSKLIQDMIQWWNFVKYLTSVFYYQIISYVCFLLHLLKSMDD